MDRSIIVCSRNRGPSLGKALESLGQLVPHSATEIILVDNGSTDDTAAVALRFAAQSPFPCRVITERSPGLSRARNCGIAAAEGSVLLFTDDDVIVPANWAEALAAPIERGEATATVGEISLPPDRQRPWMTREHLAALVSTASIDKEHPALIGASMAVDHDSLVAIGGFHPILGAGALGGREDILADALLKERGGTVVFVEGAAVEHHYDLSRLDRRHLTDRLAADARSEAWIAWHYYGYRRRAPVLRFAVSSVVLGLARAIWRPKEGVPGWEARLIQSAQHGRQARLEQRRQPEYFTPSPG